MDSNHNKKTFFKIIDPIVFFPTFIIMIGVVILGLVNYDALLKGLLGIYEWATDYFSWAYAAITVISLTSLVVIMMHPVGKIKLGGENAVPTMSTFAWFSVTVTSTIGVSLILWGNVEPIVHFVNPPTFANVKPLTDEAAAFALSTGYIHWSFNQYALYTICAVAIAIPHYNKNQPLSVGAGMYHVFGEKRIVGRVVDSLCLLVIVGGIATSLGIGIQQLASGIEFSFGISPSSTVKIVIALLIVATYSVASVSGIQKGITYISNFNVYLFFGLLIFTYIVGPTTFINETTLQANGEFLTTGIRRTLTLQPISGDPWPGNWTVNFYVANAAYAPLMGVFLAMLGKGRSIRQFIGMNLLVCSVFNIVWISIFGAAAIFEQVNGVDIMSIMNDKGLQTAAFAFFSTLPLSKLVLPAFTIAIFFSFVTMAESMTTSMAALSMEGGLQAHQEEPDTRLKLVWGIFVGIVGYYLVGLVGVDVIKYTYMVFGFPIFIIMAIMIYSLIKGIFFPDFQLKEALKKMK